jgi:hypothetical protein
MIQPPRSLHSLNHAFRPASNMQITVGCVLNFKSPGAMRSRSKNGRLDWHVRRNGKPDDSPPGNC